MIFRSRLLITAAVLCHLLLAPRIVTSQLLSSQHATQEAVTPEQTTIAPLPPAAKPATNAEDITIRAQQQEKDKQIFKLRGDVEIDFRSFILRADRGTYDSETGW